MIGLLKITNSIRNRNNGILLERTYNSKDAFGSVVRHKKVSVPLQILEQPAVQSKIKREKKSKMKVTLIKVGESSVCQQQKYATEVTKKTFSAALSSHYSNTDTNAQPGDGVGSASTKKKTAKRKKKKVPPVPVVVNETPHKEHRDILDHGSVGNGSQFGNVNKHACQLSVVPNFIDRSGKDGLFIQKFCHDFVGNLLYGDNKSLNKLQNLGKSRKVTKFETASLNSLKSPDNRLSSKQIDFITDPRHEFSGELEQYTPLDYRLDTQLDGNIKLKSLEQRLNPSIMDDDGSLNSTINGKLNTKKKSKQKGIEETEAIRKQIKDLRYQQSNRKFNKELQSYLNVCVSVGMLNRACHTLRFYRQAAARRVISIKSYNAVMMGYYAQGNMMRVLSINSWLHESGLRPNATSQALHIAAQHKMPPWHYTSGSATTPDEDMSAESHTESSGSEADSLEQQKASDVVVAQRISHLLSEMEKKYGMSLDQLFSEADLVQDMRQDLLAGVRRVRPNYTPSPLEVHDTPRYTSHLLNDVNTKQDYGLGDDGRQPGHSPSPYLVDDSAIVEQLNMESAGTVPITSIVLTEDDPTQTGSSRLEKWQVRWEVSLLQALEKELAVLKKRFFAGHREKTICLYPYLVILEPKELVNIMMHELESVAGSTGGGCLSGTARYIRVSEKVQSLFLAQYKREAGVTAKLERIYRDYAQLFAQYAEDGVVPRVLLLQLICQARSDGPHLDHAPPSWPHSVMHSLGSFLYAILVKNTFVWTPINSEKQQFPALYEDYRKEGYRNIKTVTADKILCQLYRQTHTLHFPPTELPMLCPPMPWAKLNLGGYLINHVPLVRMPVLQHNHCSVQYNRLVEAAPGQLYPVMDSINLLSSTPWRVNKEMLDVLTEVFIKNNGDDLDVPPHPSQHPRPPNTAGKFSKELLEYNKKKNEMHSLWCTALYKVSIAHHFKDRVFWFPHNVDFRGRAYPCPPHLSHLNSDVFRSLLHFAVRKPLGDRGLEWLKIHIVNLSGLKKHNSLSSRLMYCEDILPDILDSAERPLTGNKWWTQSDEPWQTLAACKELHAALKLERPQDYESCLPIHQDGSCNGLQHYAALGRDTEGATSVNLAPSEVPQDVYTAVSNIVEQLRVRDAADPNCPQRVIASVLATHIKRKVVKQTVMTTVYGVTRFGAILQIEKQLKECDGLPPELRRAAANYLSGNVFKSLELMFTATKDIQEWFTECARLISTVRRETVEWVTPLGLPIAQPYYKPFGVSDLVNLSSSIDISLLPQLQIPNTMKQRNAFPPNFIHSLDASHMMLTSLHCGAQNLTFASVHDCYWTHAATVDSMSKICRDQFVSLHSEPLLTLLSSFLQQRFGYTHDEFTHDGSATDGARLRLNHLLKAVPELGEFDIELVKDSKFFFS